VKKQIKEHVRQPTTEPISFSIAAARKLHKKGGKTLLNVIIFQFFTMKFTKDSLLVPVSDLNPGFLIDIKP